jgi:hypothetical protein
MSALWIDPDALECEASAEAKAAGAAIASEVLFNLTGRRWPGVVTDVVRLRAGCVDRCSSWWWDSSTSLGTWRTGWRPWRIAWCGPGGWKLPGFPVLEVVAVDIDGVVVPQVEYRVEDRRRLVREAGSWPEDGSMSVEYRWGGRPGPGGTAAAAAYACQLAKSMSPNCKDCRLPRRVTTVTRQGVSAAVLDPMTLAADGLTGLAEVDSWVQAVLLGDRRRRGTVIVPGHRQSVRFAP